MSSPAITTNVNQDNDGNIGVAGYSQFGAVHRVPFLTASLNVDENGNVGVFGGGNTSSGSADSAADLLGTLSADTPFNALTLKPTTASFGTNSSSTIMFATDDLEMIAVIFTAEGLKNHEVGQVLPMFGIELPDDDKGLWVFTLPDLSSGTADLNDIQLHQITDGENIFVPAVNLSELTGIKNAVLGNEVVDGAGLFQGSTEEGNINITSITGCEIFYRFTQEQALQYLLDQKTGRPSAAPDILPEPLPLPTIPAGINPLTLMVNAHDGTFILPMNNTSEWIVDWGDDDAVIADSSTFDWDGEDFQNLVLEAESTVDSNTIYAEANVHVERYTPTRNALIPRQTDNSVIPDGWQSFDNTLTNFGSPGNWKAGTFAQDNLTGFQYIEATLDEPHRIRSWSLQSVGQGSGQLATRLILSGKTLDGEWKILDDVRGLSTSNFYMSSKPRMDRPVRNRKLVEAVRITAAEATAMSTASPVLFPQIQVFASDGSIKTSRVVEIDEVLLLRRTDGGTYETETYWKREE